MKQEQILAHWTPQNKQQLQPNQTPHTELCDEALKEYEKISTEVCDWNSLIPEAIKFYKQHGGTTGQLQPEVKLAKGFLPRDMF